MGAGGLNGELRNQSDQVDTIFRYHFGFPPNDLRAGAPVTPTQRNNQTTTSSITQHFASNSRTSPTTSTDLVEEMVCYLCSVNFTLFKRKSTCNGCLKTLCANCFTQGLGPRDRHSHCITCRALTAPIIYKDFLKNLKVKDLQDYLKRKNVVTSQCKEKRDLVELIVQHNQIRMQPEAPRRTPQPTQPSNPSQQYQNTYNPYSGLFASPDNGSTRVPSNGFPTQPPAPAQSQGPAKNKVPGKTIDDLTEIEQVSNLSVKELKSILNANFVDFKGCVEKAELLDKVRLLWKSKNDQDKQKDNPDDAADETCKVCMDSSIDCVLLECGHMVACIQCSKQLAECPICRQHILRIVRVFKA